MKKNPLERIVQQDICNGRREFLKKATLGSIGLSLFPNEGLSTPSSPQGLPFFFRFLGNFAESVGFGLVSSYIYDYLKSSYGGQSPAINMYNQPRGWGYYDEPVWGYYGSQNYYIGANILEENDNKELAKVSFDTNISNQRFYSYLFAPWLAQGQINGLACFLNLTRDRLFGGYLAAPTIHGLYNAVPDLISSGICRYPFELSQVLLPLAQSSVSKGIFQTSYTKPDEYVSNKGNISVNYKNQKDGEGLVRVTYKINHLTGQKTVFDNSYGVNYPSTSSNFRLFG